MFNYDDIKEYGRPYVIAELGANHNGDMDLAKKMIDTAKECGADAIKLQSFQTRSIFSKKVFEDNYFLNDDYRNRTDYTLESIIEKYKVDRDQHFMLKEYCDKVGIDFASTPFTEEEVDMLVDLDVPFIKVASMDLDNIPFLKYIAKTGKPVILSNGLCPLSDTSDAVDVLRANGCKELILLHCVSIYPPKDEEVQLNNMDMLRLAFNCKVGYSDHTIGTVAPIMAMAKGACVIEKHFTLDKNMVGWDHKISADPAELKVICDAAKVSYKMLGTTNKVVNENQERRDAFKRSIVAKRPIAKGHIITEEDLDFRRPGTGISPKYYEFLIGKEAKRDITFDEIIQKEDF